MNRLLQFLYRGREVGVFVITLARSTTQRKHIFRWLRSLRKNYLLDEPSPWLVFDAIDFISEHINSSWVVFEYGSGGSTLFWLSKGLHCVSVEHDAKWAEAVKARFSTAMPIDYHLIVPELATFASDSAAIDISDPQTYRSGDIPFLNYTFKHYAETIDVYPDEYFDLILIDGRARPSCILHSVPKLKAGGLLVLDNADRKYYLEKTQALLDNFIKHEFKGAIPCNSFYSQTNVYQKLSTQ